jgi:dihydropteroate synthase
MGVINVTPDSFSDGGRAMDPDVALDLALEMEDAGAALLDVGAESTRPGAEPVTADDEWARLRPVLRRFAGRVRLPVSIDTYKAGVARRALDEGAVIVNDVSGLRYDPALGEVAAAARAALIVMHTRGRSREMYELARYRDVVAEVARELQWSLACAAERGVEPEKLIVDPGLGFAKTATDSLAALAGLDRLAALGRPILVGPSRKSFLAAAGPLEPQERDWATAAAVTAAVLGGAHIVRVHRVGAMAQVARVADAIRAASGLS